MPGLGELFETDEILGAITGGGWWTVGLGVGAALLLTRGFRPLAKQAMKGYMAASEGVQRATSGAREGLQDMYAEARAERQQGGQPQQS